jgi:hypothetical protein
MWSISNSRIKNCLIENNWANASATAAVTCSTTGLLIGCELTCLGTGSNASAVTFTSAYNSVVGCYIRDTLTGIILGSNSGNAVINSVIDTCPVGISASTSANSLILGNTIYGSVKAAITYSTAIAVGLYNNIISGCLAGLSRTGTTLNNFFGIDNNCWNNTVDITTLAADLAHTAGALKTLTSLTLGFTAAMVGSNIIITSGTNFTAGTYLITAYGSATSVTVNNDLWTSAQAGSVGFGYISGNPTGTLPAKGLNCVTADPSMTDPANGDFSIVISSPASGTALDVSNYTTAVI